MYSVHLLNIKNNVFVCVKWHPHQKDPLPQWLRICVEKLSIKVAEKWVCYIGHWRNQSWLLAVVGSSSAVYECVKMSAFLSDLKCFSFLLQPSETVDLQIKMRSNESFALQYNSHCLFLHSTSQIRLLTSSQEYNYKYWQLMTAPNTSKSSLG